MRAIAQSTVHTREGRHPGIFQEQEVPECEFLRYPVSTGYVRPLMTSELLGTVQRQITDLFDGRCKNLDSDGKSTMKIERAENLAVMDTEFGVLAEILRCLERWEGGSLTGVSAELRPKCRKAVKRQIAILLDTPLQSCSNVEGELGDPAPVKFPIVRNLVEAWERSIKCSQLTTAQQEVDDVGAVPPSVGNDLIQASTRGRDSEVEVSNQTPRTDLDIVQGPAVVRWKPEIREAPVHISIGSPGLEPESSRTLPAVVDIVRGGTTGLSGRRQGNFRKQPIVVDIVRNFSVLQTTKPPFQQCGRDESCSDINGSCRCNLCFPILKSKPLRRLLRNLLSKYRHPRPIALTPPHRMPDKVISERMCSGRPLQRLRSLGIINPWFRKVKAIKSASCEC